jgi:hypothetical protein
MTGPGPQKQITDETNPRAHLAPVTETPARRRDNPRGVTG